MILDLICTIAVVVCEPVSPGDVRCANTQTEKSIKGSLVAEGEYNYVGDFSVEAKRLNFVGEYDTVVVNKDRCVRVDQLKTSRSK
jgi:hypothetical protein